MLEISQLLPHIGLDDRPVVNYKLNFKKEGDTWVVVGRAAEVDKAKLAFHEFYGTNAERVQFERGLQVFVVKKDATLAEFWVRTEVPFTGFDRERWIRLEAE